MIFRQLFDPQSSTYTYLLADSATREAVLIDPGDEVDQLLAAAFEAGVDIRRILLTHAHVDHVTGVAAAKEALDVPVHLHRDDLFLYEQVVEHGRLFGLKVRPQPPIDFFYDGTPLAFGDYSVTVRHTPGHCPGGVCLEVRRGGQPGAPHLFVGDTLFAGSIGRTDLPGGDYGVLMRSITGVLLPLGDDAIVHPGHGPDTTIGRERQTNPFVLEYVRSL